MLGLVRARTACAKEDLVLVSQLRRLPHTAADLWHRSRENLVALALEPNTPEEFAAVRAARSARRAFEAAHPLLTLDALKGHLRAAGGTCGAGMTRGGVVDALLARGGIAQPLELDADQAAAVARWKAPRTLIYAGPGAGKTTTVCHMVRAAVEAGARAIVLAYNVVAEETLAARLNRMRVPRIQNAQLVGSTSGAAVLTFDKFAARVNGGGGKAYAREALKADVTDSFRQALEAAAGRVDAQAAAGALGAWDLVVVDEAQDINAAHAALVHGLLACAGAMEVGARPRLVASGDPRQELYGGAHWFSHAWASAPAADKIVLRYNHRSDPRIVAALNAFSRANFPTLHCDQIAARPLPRAPAADAAGVDGVDSADMADGVDSADMADGVDGVDSADMAPIYAPHAIHAIHATQGSAAPALFPAAASAAVSAAASAAEPAHAAVRVVVIAQSPEAQRASAREAETLAMLAIGEAVGEGLANGEPGACYAVAPVTTGKFGYDRASTLARQVVSTRRPGALVYEATSADKLALSAYAIATSQKIKGTERRRVVVFGADETYSLCVDHAAYVRRVFVALSRAQDELVVIVRASVSPDALLVLRSVLDFANATDMVTRAPERMNRARTPSVAVADAGTGVGALSGLCACRGVGGVEIVSVTSASPMMMAMRVVPPLVSPVVPPPLVPPIPLGDALGDADFVGVFSETLVLRALGMQTVARCDVVATRDYASHGDAYCPATATDAPHFRVVVGPDVAPRLRAVCDAIFERSSSAAADGAYVHAVLRYALAIRSEWTLSERFARVSEAQSAAAVAVAQGIVNIVAALKAQGLPGFQTTRAPDAFLPSCAINVACRRALGASPACTIACVPDAILGGVPVELKHVAALSDDHRRQAAIYATLLGASHALLVNTRDGAAEIVAALAVHDVMGVARATAATREARAAGRRPALALRAIAPPAEAFGSCLVAVDAETDAHGPFEISAVAYDADNGAVLATFDELAFGVRDDARAAPRPHSAPFTSVADLTGVAGLDAQSAEQRAVASAALVERFRAWAACLPTRRSFLHWGGSERELIGDPGAAIVDVHHRVFMPWLEAAGEARRGRTTLADAAGQVVPSIPFAPHRALDDALLTLCVYLAAVRMGAQL
jgi:hypothetical protein